ncbi:MAG TPA: VOC family protein [Acidimicrobiales bacterium]|nr:VOC family protein [Acidimicrobiales bacterium]
MRSTLRNVTFDCRDAYTLATFWSAVVDRPIHEENRPGDDEVVIPGGDGTPNLLFEAVPEPKTVKNRVHLDLQPDHPRDAEVERLLGLGATLVADHRRPDGTGWATLADPEGNELCVERSVAERASTGG